MIFLLSAGFVKCAHKYTKYIHICCILLSSTGNIWMKLHTYQIFTTKRIFWVLSIISVKPFVHTGECDCIIQVVVEPLYILWIPLYELRILTFRQLLKHVPPSGTPQYIPGVIIGKRWETQHYTLQADLKSKIQKYSVLMRPEFAKFFYIKTNWSIEGVGAMIMQADKNPQQSNNIRNKKKLVHVF